MKNAKVLFLVVSIFVVGQFFSTVAKGPVGYADSDELLTSGYLLSVAHPSGYPVSTLLAHMAMKILPFSPALSANAFFALLNALSVAFFAYVLYRIFPLSNKLSVKRIGIPLLLGLLISSTFLVWLYSSFAENTSLLVFFTLTLYGCALMWYRGPQTQRPSWFILTALVFGLSLAHKQTHMVLAPLLIGLIFLKSPRLFLPLNQNQFAKTMAKGIGLSLIAFISANLVLIAFNARQQPFSWYFPQSLQGLTSHLLRADYSGYFVEEGVERHAYFGEFLPRFFSSQLPYFEYLGQHLGWLTLTGFFLLLIYVVKTKNSLGIVLGISALITGPIFAGYLGVTPPELNDLSWRLSTGILHRQFITGQVATLIFIAYSLMSTLTSTRKKSLKIPLNQLVISIIVLQIGLNLYQNYPVIKRASQSPVSTYAQSMLETADPNAVIICGSDIACFSLMYHHYVENIRPDLTLLTKNSRYSTYLLKQNPQIYPFSYRDNPYFYANLIAYNTSQRPTYLTAPDNYYIEYLGLSGNPFYLVPENYLFRVVTQAPESIPQLSDAGIISKLYHYEDSSKDLFGVGFKDYFSNLFVIQGMLQAFYGNQIPARQLFEHAIGLTPANQEAKDLLMQIDDYEGSDIYTPGMKVDLATLEASAASLLENRQLDEAYATTLTLSYLDPTNPQHRLQLANLLETGNYFEEAITEYRHVLLFDPQNQEATSSLKRLNASSL
jgi:hypothetical protein